MDQGDLFDRGVNEGDQTGAARPPRVGPKRLRHAVRDQIEFRQCALDDLLPEDHEARIVWDYVCGLDLSALRELIQAVEDGPGQAPADPCILMTLWLYATLRGVGSARELNRQCQHHAAYRWICGDVSMNYHTLSDFRTRHVDLLDRLLVESVASLRTEGLVTLDRVAQDGVRVRASAGAASFRRQPTLEAMLAEAEEQVARLRKEAEADPGAQNSRKQAARKRAAEERRSADSRRIGTSAGDRRAGGAKPAKRPVLRPPTLRRG